MKTFHNSGRAAAVVMAAVFVLAMALVPPQAVLAKKKATFKLSKSSVALEKEQTVTLTSDKKKEKIRVSVNNPAAVSCVQTRQSGKKTIFKLTPVQAGSATITFKAGKKKATLKVTVPISKAMIERDFHAQLFYSSQTGTNSSVRIMVHNYTGVPAYFSNTIAISGDLDWDGHWFDPNADASSQYVTQYALVNANEDRQLEYYDAAVYGLKDNDSYNIMTFRTKASVTATVYFGSVSPENAYTIMIDGNGVTTVVKQ